MEPGGLLATSPIGGSGRAGPGPTTLDEPGRPNEPERRHAAGSNLARLLVSAQTVLSSTLLAAVVRLIVQSGCFGPARRPPDHCGRPDGSLAAWSGARALAKMGRVRDGSSVGTGEITWRRLTADDFALLAGWLAQPHVRRWWNHDPSPAAVARDFGPSARGEDPSEDLLVLLGGEPVGLVQRCRLHDFPEYVAELAPVVDVPTGAVTLDYLLGDEDRTGHGLGPRILEALVEDSWRAYADAPCVLVPVVAGNRRSWRALEKAGFRRVAEGDLAPDNPVDPPLHVVYRIDRPAAGAPSG